LIVNTVLGVVAGRIGDGRGRGQTLTTGILLYIIGALLGAVAPDLGLLVAARAIQGVGAAVLIVLPMSLVAEVIPPETAGRSIGLLASMSAVGTAAGPSLGGLLVAELGWRSAFITMALLGILNFYFAKGLFSGPGRDSRAGRPALAGALTKLLEDSSLKAALLLNAVVAAVMMSALIVGPFFLSEGLRVDTRTTGFAMSVGPIVSIFSGRTGGIFVDRYGVSRMTLAGLLMLLLGGCGFVFLPSVFGILGFVLSAAVSSFGYQMFQAANALKVMSDSTPESRGLYSGLLSFSRQIGLVMGALIASVPQVTYSIAVVMTALSLAVVLFSKTKEEKWIRMH
jgi:MFS family permease